MNLFNKNTPAKWSNYDIIKYLDEFIELYKERPIKDNTGGMKFPHMFGLFFMLKDLKPDFVVESGIYKGQSTWLIERTLPNVNVLSLDPHLNQRKYISKSDKVKYSNLDFTEQDFFNIPKNALVFLMIIKIFMKDWFFLIFLDLNTSLVKIIIQFHKVILILLKRFFQELALMIQEQV